MIELLFALATVSATQDLALAPRRPLVECSEHLTNARARHGCLRDLLRDAERELDAALENTRRDAEDADLDSGGMFRAAERFDTAQTHWQTYRDAECARRGALMFVSEDSRTDITLDCQVAMTRARASELESN